MARNEAKVKFTAETRDLTEQLKSANSTLAALRAGLKLNEAELKNNGDQTEYLKNKQQLLESELQANAQKQQALNGKLETAKNIYGENSTEVQNWSRKLTDAKTEQQNLEAELKDCTSAVEDSGEAAEQSAHGGWSILNGIIADLASNAIQSAVNKLQDFAKETMDLGIDFSSSMSNVQAISGATEDEIGQLEQKARDLGATTVFSASDVSDAFGYMAMAGWDTQQMMDGVSGVLDLAASSGEDLATTSDIVTDALTAFGMEAGEAGDLADIMAAASSNANTNVSMLGESFKYVAPVAGALGYSAEDTAVALGLMANSGIKASQGGTALRTVLTNMSKPTDDMAYAMDQLGISLTDDEGNMRSLHDVMDQMRSGFGELMISEEEFNGQMAQLDQALSDGSISQEEYNDQLSALTERAYGAEGAEKAKYAAMLAGKEGMSGLLAIVNASEEDYGKLTSAIEGSSGAAEEMAATMNDNLGGDIKEMNSALEELKLKVYDGVQQPLRDIVQLITGSVIPAATATLQFIQQHSTAIGVLAGIIGIIVTAMLLQNAVQAVQAAMNAAETASLGGLIAAKMASAAASWAALAPYIAIVAAIAAVIAIIVICVMHWDQIRQKVTEVAETVRTNVTQAWNNLMSTLSNIMSNIRSTISNVWSNIQSTISEKVSSIRSKVSSTFETIKTKMITPFQTARDKIKGIIDKIKGFFPLSIGKIFSNLKIPHISVEGGEAPYGIAGMGSLPHFSVSWHAKGVVFDAPTLIPTIGGIHGVGEAGPEAVSPVSVLQSYVGAAVQKFAPHIDYDLLAHKVAGACAKMNISIDVDKRQLGRVVREVV